MVNNKINTSLQKPKSSMSLLGLLFFMLGSVDLYGRMRVSQQSNNPSDAWGMPSFLKLAALGAIAAGALELGHLTHLVG
jgi:hypothetical protein